MSTFNCGERVRIMEEEGLSEKVYRIKGLKKCRKGGTLYLLKPLEENPVLRLYHDDGRSIIERIC